MDIFRKELNAIYTGQRLGEETLSRDDIAQWRAAASALAATADELDVITDASSDHCYIYSGRFASLLGITSAPSLETEADSSDEDEIYQRMHPEDLVDKRMLEYEFFKFINNMDGPAKKAYKATCRIRMMNGDGRYFYADNSTQIVQPSPRGKIWLILCRYSISSDQSQGNDISPVIVCTSDGEVKPLALSANRRRILSPREKAVLLLIKDGKPSKQIADILGISIHTVNRHRQNIIEKLSVHNSVEAIMAATAMRLI